MKLLTAQQIRDWDAYTIRHEPISSIDLMEHAANLFVKQLKKIVKHDRTIKIFCGLGNNGGDGLAIAKLLCDENFLVEVFVVEYSKNRSTDFSQNLKRLEEKIEVSIISIHEKSILPIIHQSDIIIDALFGTGLNKNIEGLALKVIQHINQFSAYTIAVDMPSGLQADIFYLANLESNKIIHAHQTITFQVPKQSFLHAETFAFVGEFTILDIGLKKEFLDKVDSKHFYMDKDELPQLKLRNKFSHKGTFGHAICIGGSYGKIGANLLMSKACLKTGVGLVTSYIPKVGYTILQTAFSECMVLTDDEILEIRNFPSTENYDAIAVGPGLGMNEYTIKSFYKWISSITKPCVIDADALNISSQLLIEHHDSFRFPKHAILTPHPKEFDRLAGISKNSVERIEKQIHFAQHHQVFVVLKGAHTTIATPDGNLYFNSTGNSAMATAGSGDVLTGIIVSLLAQGYEPKDAAIFGVYLHGLSGDLAVKNKATLIASDIIEALPFALFSLLS